MTRDIAGIQVTGVQRLEDGAWFGYFSVSETPINGELSGLSFDLTSQRFDLVRAAIERGFESETGHTALSDDSRSVVFPMSLPAGRRFFVLYEP